MGFFNFFRRKKEGEEFPSELKNHEFEESKPAEMPQFGFQSSPGFQPSQGYQPSPAFQPQSFQQFSQDNNKDMQILNAKLDAIKAMLDTILERLEKLEKNKEESKYPLRWR